MVAHHGGVSSHIPAAQTESQPDPSLVLVGTSFRTAGIETREIIARRSPDLADLGDRTGGALLLEWAALETCNRLEFYFVSPSPDEAARRALQLLGGPDVPRGSFYTKTGVDVIQHLFEVASGLDSPVLGEGQILEQVREAGRTARKAGRAKSILSSLFDAAYSSGRRVRAGLPESKGDRSVSAFALRHILRELGHAPSTVLLIGSGETAKLAALKLRSSSVLLLSARRGAEARFPNAQRVPRRRLREAAGKSELIIAATRRHGYALTKKDLPGKKRVVILDLGFPRNVEPSVRGIKPIKLYDLDAVAGWALSEGRHGDSSVHRAVEEEAQRFNSWLRASRLTPTLASIYRWGERIRDEETLAALRRLPGLSEHEREIVESLSKRLTGKLLSPHANFVKEGEGEEEQSERLVLLESIFRDGGK